MISAVDKININVRDQDAARHCWIETMGFSLVTDEPIGEEPGGARWIEVRPPHSAVTLVLYSLTFDASRLGSLSPVLFTCDDIQKTHQELTARGVEFPDPPGRRSWGWWATFTDNEGNLYGPGQRSTDKPGQPHVPAQIRVI